MIDLDFNFIMPCRRHRSLEWLLVSALFVSFVIGAVLLFWNVHSFICCKRRPPNFREVFSLNVSSLDRRAFCFLFFVFCLSFVFGVGYIFCSLMDSQRDFSVSSDDFILVLLFLSLLFNYLIRLVAKSALYESLDDGKRYVWDVWKVRVKDCGDRKVAGALRASNVLSFLILLMFFAAKL
ncbi:hypothetical protein [Marinobacter persicus]|uniref:Uncharacterized protein n=1 Tax=Marinobacter persicus TaxID=930118 RepID=A0A2S6G227_9GAMM|nr:hypothetical protein [Marinobacter persicus]PPK49870.1 hypothetical protein BY455_1462 [Marinobacter persicus]PPK51392.1 hypothetical protein B0H24_10472 [Marinobacter persicus]PPK55802.1 hypothetical protein BY454_1472 [Marinobacter persicus]